MNSKTTIYISQGVDYLGFLNAKLRDLRGWSTLLNELVQNADDPEDTTRLTLDVTDDALVVENDGLFTDCGRVEDLRCGFDPVGDGRKCCDFHAFRRVASGHKRAEEDTTGAFGIGFISVYQITDRPSLRSSRWQWVLNPEAEEALRIEAELSTQAFPGTRFVLPWARENTALRARLGLEPVPADVVDRMCAELKEALVQAAPFLKRLTTLELRRRGKPEFSVRCERDEAAGEILIDANGTTHIWKRLKADFAGEAETLRGRYGATIEAKRKADIIVAVPLDGMNQNGRLYATLPSEDELKLPVLINADFYPSSDRKRILFSQDYQGEWNRAAIRAAAVALSQSLPRLRESLRPAELWALLNAAKDLQRFSEEGGVDAVFSSFWERIAPALREGAFVYTSAGGWSSPSEVRLLQSAKEEALIVPLLEALAQNAVHLDLQPFSNLLRDNDVGVKYLTLDDITSVLKRAGLDRARAKEQVTPWLLAAGNRERLTIVAERLLERVPKESREPAKQGFCDCAIALSVEDDFVPLAGLRTADAETRKLFAPLNLQRFWAATHNPTGLISWIETFAVSDALKVLEQAGIESLGVTARSDPSWIKSLVEWFERRRDAIVANAELRDRLRTLPIWPAVGSLWPLDELAVPGDFEDPLRLAKILDAEVAQRHRTFLIKDLRAGELTLPSYLTEHVPRSFAGESLPSSETRRQLVHLLATHVGQLLDSPKIAVSLRDLPLVECSDGMFRAATDVYFESEVIREALSDTALFAEIGSDAPTATRDLLAWLGVGQRLRAADVLRRVDQLTKNPPSDQTRLLVQRLFKGLVDSWDSISVDEREVLEELRDNAWLPVEGQSAWHQPRQVFAVFLRYLFESQAAFLDIPTSVQQRAGDVLKFLGIQTNPSVVMVVNHLLHSAQAGAGLNLEVYVFLNQKVEDPAVNQLKGRKCLRLDDGGYVDPGLAFWGHHPFGSYRVKLADVWRKYQELLDKLGVKSDPVGADAMQVLREIDAKYADNRMLSVDDHSVVMGCWNLLGQLLPDDNIATLIKELSDVKSIPDSRQFLRQPREIFFEDRPGLAGKFGQMLQSHVIPRAESAWEPMEVAGVQPLSKVVSIEVVECTGDSIDEAFTQKLSQRWSLIRRVFGVLSRSDSFTVPKAAPQVWAVDRLIVVYKMLGMPSDAEAVPAYLDFGSSLLYFQRGVPRVESAMARELAFGIFPDPAAGPLAAAIKEVLLADDEGAARTALNELGIPEVELEATPTAVAQESGIGAKHDEGHESLLGVADNTSVFADGSEQTHETSSEDTHGRSAAEEADVNGEEDADVDSARTRTSREQSASGRRARSPGATSSATRNKRFIGRSYMMHDRKSDDSSILSEEAKAQRSETDRKGVEYVLRYEREGGRYPMQMPPTHEGYDVESRDDNGQLVRYIEVKSLTGPWDGFGVGLSAPQFEKAQQEKAVYWLYVVEDLNTGEPTLHTIQNPAGKVVEFRFDDAWQETAESQAAPRARSLRDVIRERSKSARAAVEVNNDDARMPDA